LSGPRGEGKGKNWGRENKLNSNRHMQGGSQAAQARVGKERRRYTSARNVEGLQTSKMGIAIKGKKKQPQASATGGRWP